MKILQINAVYGYGSTGTIMRDLHCIALKNGIDSYIAFPHGNGEPNERSIVIGNSFDRKIHAALSRISGKQAYFSKSTTMRFIKDVERLNPDIIHLHNLHNNYININILLKYIAAHNIATVITMHDCWYFTGGCFHYTDVGCLKWQQRCINCPKRYLDTPAYLYDSSNKIQRDRDKYINAIPNLTLVGCSEWIAKECRKSILGNKNVITIPNGFDLEVFKPTPSTLRRELKLEGKKILLAPVSKWAKDVNRSTLDYFVKNMDSNMVLLLFGGKSHIETLSDQIRSIGYVSSQEEMAKIYSMADVLVNCSREDTLSSINIEAQACGTPVVTYQDTGNAETVDGLSGLSIESGNAMGLLNGVREILNMDKEQLSMDCQSFVSSKFEKNTNFKRYIELYNKILNV